jgi:pyruvate/2-oxoglutarate dehydrogenase complex dihydrolipoamide acyltransferase (E2) component
MTHPVSHDLLMPRMSQDMETGQVVEWLKAEGDPVAEGEAVLIVETDKANMDVESPAAGILRLIVADVGADVAVGGRLAVIAAADEDLPVGGSTGAAPVVTSDDCDQAVAAGATDPAVPAPRTAERRPSSPAARRLAVELGVDIGAVPGSGADGLVSEADVRAFAERQGAIATAEPEDGNLTEVPLLGMRRRSAERLALSRRTVADVTTVIDVDMETVAVHHAVSRRPYTAYVAWATARALAEFPMLNASFADDRVLLRHDIHLGVAVAVEGGLVVPVVRHADRLGAAEMAAAIEELSVAARLGDVSPEQLRGSTFTLTNSGTFGSLFFTPIVNLPEVAILGMGRVAEVPVVRDGAIVAGTVMYLSLSYDHRAVDGTDAVRFLADVKRRLEAIAEGEA